MNNPEQSNNYQSQSIEHYETESIIQELFGNVVDHIRERKEVHKNFIEYTQQILTTTEQQQIIDMFGGKNLKWAINNFLKEKKKAVQEAEPKKDGTWWDRSKLNQLNLTMLFLGNPSMNAILNGYYDDFVLLRHDRSWSHKQDLLKKYDLSNMNPEEIKKEREKVYTIDSNIWEDYVPQNQQPVWTKYNSYDYENTKIDIKRNKENMKKEIWFDTIISLAEQYTWLPYKRWWVSKKNGVDCSWLWCSVFSELSWNKFPRLTALWFERRSKKLPTHDVKAWNFMYFHDTKGKKHSSIYHIEMATSEPYQKNGNWYINTFGSSTDKMSDWKKWVGYRERKIVPWKHSFWHFI